MQIYHVDCNGVQGLIVGVVWMQRVYI